MRRARSVACQCLLVTLAISTAAKANEVVLTCTNVASKTTWDIKIDTAMGTVNGAPANIDDNEVTWSVPWPSGGRMNYKLDRTSGKLLEFNPPADASWNDAFQCKKATPVF